MGKKKIEKAVKVVETLKTNLTVLEEKKVDTTFVKALDDSIKQLVKLEKEIDTLCEKLAEKKQLFDQKKKETEVSVKGAKAIIKTNLDKALLKSKDKSKSKVEKKEKEDKPK